MSAVGVSRVGSRASVANDVVIRITGLVAGCERHFVSDIAIFVLKRDVKLQLTN